MGNSAFEQALDMLKGKTEEIGQKVNPFLSILNKPFQVAEQIGRTTGTLAGQVGRIAKTLPYDYPYRVASLSNALQQAVNFNIPYQEEPSALEKMQENIYQKAPETKKLALESILGEGSDEYTPIAQPSAQMRPYFQGRPETTAGKVLKQAALQNFGVYPAAQEYLQTIPFSEFDYPDKDIYGQANNVDSGQRFITFRRGIEDEELGQEVARHELLHQAVNVFGIKKLTNFVNAFNQAYQANPKRYKPILAWIQYYKRDMPEYFQENPTAEANELFAQIGATFGPNVLKDPYLSKYYTNIFVQK